MLKRRLFGNASAPDLGWLIVVLLGIHTSACASEEGRSWSIKRGLTTPRLGCVQDSALFDFEIDDAGRLLWKPRLPNTAGETVGSEDWLGSVECPQRYSSMVQSPAARSKATARDVHLVQTFETLRLPWDWHRRFRLSRGRSADALIPEVLGEKGARSTINKRENPNGSWSGCDASNAGAMLCCLARTWILPIPFPEPTPAGRSESRADGSFTRAQSAELKAFLSSTGLPLFKKGVNASYEIVNPQLVALIGPTGSSGDSYLNPNTVTGWFASSRSTEMRDQSAIRRFGELNYLRLKLLHYVATGEGLHGEAEAQALARPEERATLAKRILVEMLMHTFYEDWPWPIDEGIETLLRWKQSYDHWYREEDPESRRKVSERWQERFAKFVYEVADAHDLTPVGAEAMLALMPLYEGKNFDALASKSGVP